MNFDDIRDRELQDYLWRYENEMVPLSYDPDAIDDEHEAHVERDDDEE